LKLLAAALGALCTGCALGWTSNLQTKILKFDYGFLVTDMEFSLIGSMLNFGAACVCILMGFLINWIGRRGTMLFILIPYIIGWVLLVVASNVTMLIIGRALIGIACGGCCVSAPVRLELTRPDVYNHLRSLFSLFLRLRLRAVSGLHGRDC
jgi:MFS family permease